MGQSVNAVGSSLSNPGYAYVAEMARALGKAAGALLWLGSTPWGQISEFRRTPLSSRANGQGALAITHRARRAMTELIPTKKMTACCLAGVFPST